MPKKLDGLGIRKARETITSLLGKLIWGLRRECDSLWVHVFKHKLGEGKSSFWFSNWSEIRKLAEPILYVDIHDLDMRVNGVYLDEYLNFNSLYTNIPLGVCDRLEALPICLNSMAPSRLTWKSNLDGIYTARDGYYWLKRLEVVMNTTNNNPWKWVCHIPTLEKVKFFLWTTLYKYIPKRSMLCHQEAETTRHSLRDCEFATRFWKSISFLGPIFFQGDILYDWIGHGIDAICFLKHNLSHPMRTLTWNAHKGSNVILNVDGNSLGKLGVSNFGGLIQNVDCACVHSFVSNIGYSNILHVEVMTLYYGSCMALEHGIKDLMCYSDSDTAIKLI
ncbi:uncharacterized protein LOC131637314 [Vicia villosa]|uniref:uncharacterized protein LOC131637314 n=1 Tax=Vicia villosa TaxID=3911 RepID=UPI00273C6381|nr:uncharacterized protein LOC131637314 [Vicia villosa]